MRLRVPSLFLLFAAIVCAQQDTAPGPVMKQILDRLDTLEKENRELVSDVRALRDELFRARAAVPSIAPQSIKPNEASLDERLTIEEHRTAEQAQTKVESAHKLPIQLNGMVLFNAFANSRSTAPLIYDDYTLLTGPAKDGATVRQSLLGLTFEGPHLPGDGHIDGFLSMDFFSGNSRPGYAWLRLRRAGVSLKWKNRSLSVGQDKPLISPYQPDSLAEVGVPPLAGAGNLWLWLPQARYEERVSLGTNTGLKGQVAAIQTDESYNNTTSSSLASSLERARPAIEGRFEFWHRFDDTRHFEFAPGFHVATTHVGGMSVASHIGSLDWNVVPLAKLQVSGTVFAGENLGGLGALGNGFAITPIGAVRPVNSRGGWTQVSLPLTNRLTFNIFSGLENDQSAFLVTESIVHDWSYAANCLYHLSSNVVVGAEALQMRTRSLAGLEKLQNHYDLALGYLF